MSDWHAKMQGMILQAEQNLDPYTSTLPHGSHAHSNAHTLGPRAPTTKMVLHVDRQSEVPLQTQVHELDARLRLCLNEISEMRLQVERQGQDTLQGHLGRAKDEVRRELALVEKQVTDEIRVVSHDLRCRIGDSEHASREEKRRRDDVAKKLRLRDEQYDELHEQVRDGTTRLAARVDLLEATSRRGDVESTRHDDDRIEDIRNEARYQAERMEEAKRQIGLRMDKVADTVRHEVHGMAETVRAMVREVWKEHMSSVYSKVNESLESFDATLTRQATRVKELEATCRHHEAFTEAEFASANEEVRKLQHSHAKVERELASAHEYLNGQKGQLANLRTVPDEMSRVQLGYKRVNETIPALEAISRKHTASIEVMRQIPELVEEMRWEIKRIAEPVSRQESCIDELTKRVSNAEEVAGEAVRSSEGVQAVVAGEQASFHKTTKRLNNALTKISELEEEEGRKAAALERVKHQLQEHQTSLRSLFPQVTNLSCSVDTLRLQTEPRMAQAEAQLGELWVQTRELQAVRPQPQHHTAHSRSPQPHVSFTPTPTQPAQHTRSTFDITVSEGSEDPDAERLRQEQEQRAEEDAARRRAIEVQAQNVQREHEKRAAAQRAEEEAAQLRRDAAEAEELARQQRERTQREKAAREEREAEAAAEREKEQEKERQALRRQQQATDQQEQRQRVEKRQAEMRRQREIQEAAQKEKDKKKQDDEQKEEEEAAKEQPTPAPEPIAVDADAVLEVEVEADAATTTSAPREKVTFADPTPSSPTDVLPFDIEDDDVVQQETEPPVASAVAAASKKSGSEGSKSDSSKLTFSSSTRTSQKTKSYRHSRRSSQSQGTRSRSSAGDFLLGDQGSVPSLSGAPPVVDEEGGGPLGLPKARPASIIAAAAMQTSDSDAPLRQPVVNWRDKAISSSEAEERPALPKLPETKAKTDSVMGAMLDEAGPSEKGSLHSGAGKTESSKTDSLPH